MNTQQQLIPLRQGERLRQERERQGIGLEEAAASLRIDLRVMRAIESDDMDHLASVYRRGYLAAYARFLGLDKEEINQMLESVGNEQPDLHTVFPEAGKQNQADRWLKAASYMLASLLVGTLAWQFTHEAVRLSQDGTDLVAGVEAPVSEHAPQSPGKNSLEADGVTHFNASIAALEVLRRQRASRNSGGDEAWAALNKQAPESQTPPALLEGEYTLELTASGDSWVEISDANGKQLELDLVRGGSNKQYRGLAPFNIQFGRASAVSLFIDGQPVDLEPFTEGNVTQMTLDGSDLGTGAAGTAPGNG